jgi:hypothetical protein
MGGLEQGIGGFEREAYCYGGILFDDRVVLLLEHLVLFASVFTSEDYSAAFAVSMLRSIWYPSRTKSAAACGIYRRDRMYLLSG